VVERAITADARSNAAISARPKPTTTNWSYAGLPEGVPTRQLDVVVRLKFVESIMDPYDALALVTNSSNSESSSNTGLETPRRHARQQRPARPNRGELLDFAV
jgi:hypothetical protein